jgi:hypothetical protein
LLYIYFKPDALSKMTPLLHPSSPSLLIYKKMSDNPIKFPSSPSSSEDELPSHHSSEENVSSDDWMSDYSPPWSSKKDPDEEDEDEDNVDAVAAVDDSDSDDSDSNYSSFEHRRN